jgi:drug/metabolite transporter (DMT)-like permease
MSIARADEGLPWPRPSETGAAPSMRRAFLLVLAAIALGLVGLYLVRAAVVEVGGFRLGSASAIHHLVKLAVNWRFWGGAVLMFIILLISLELYGSEELSKVVPLYSLSYVVIALIGQLFLGEHVTPLRWAGILTVVVGIGLVLRS